MSLIDIVTVSRMAVNDDLRLTDPSVVDDETEIFLKKLKILNEKF